MSGRVYLVGAGPGDPGLLTARALELIAAADVILHDRLIGAGALDGARADAEVLYVGKEGGAEAVPQERTQELMIERARAGKRVVRLKGGDPFVFGRGGEEGLALRAAGIEFEVVPGVTAGIAAPAYAGIPVTHRGLSGAVAFVTAATRAGDDSEPDWEALAAFPGTLVFYMGATRLAEIAQALIDGGRAREEHAAVVQEGTLPAQRTVTGTLETIGAAAHAAGVSAPLLLVAGSVAGLASELSWLPRRPLTGRTVAVTRARAQASELARSLERLGASVVQAPVIATRALAGEALDPSKYDLVCVTSVNAVDALFDRLAAGGRDARALAGARIAAIGAGTAAALAARGVLADVVPERSVAEGLVEALAQLPVRRALIARASAGREVLPDALRARGAEVDVVALYETLPQPLSERTLARALSADYITFTSSSTVRYFLQAAGALRDGAGEASDRCGLSPATRIVSIGPATSETLLEHGLHPDIEAVRHDVEGVIESLLADAGAASGAQQR
jgi:uroporphyrinogen III methyltransferase / synthase